MRDIGIILNDFGAANQVLSYMKYNKNNYYILQNKNVKKVINNFYPIKNIHYCKSYTELISKTKRIIFGTGNSEYEKKYLLKSLNKKIYCISVIDHFTNIEDRFFYIKKINPNEIWVYDRYIYNSLKKNFRKKCKLKKNFYLKFFLDYRKKKKIRQKNQILFLDEPFNKEKGRLPLNYFCMKYFLENFNKVSKFQNCKIAIKTHPKQDIRIIKKYLKKISLVKSVSIYNNNLEKLIFSSKYIVGITSYALNIASQLKKMTFHCKLPNQKIKLLPNKNIMSFYKISVNNN